MTIENRRKLAERIVVKKIIVSERPNLDEESINEFIRDNCENYKALANAVRIIIALALIYPLLIFLNAAVIVPAVIPGLNWIQNLTLNWIAILSIPIFPLLYLKYASKYGDFKEKLKEYKR